MGKTFKYTLKARSSGKLLASQEVDFKTFPDDWKDNGMAQKALLDHERDFINEQIKVEIIEI